MLGIMQASGPADTEAGPGSKGSLVLPKVPDPLRSGEGPLASHGGTRFNLGVLKGDTR